MIAEFISAMQHLAKKAFPEADSIANEIIIEHLKKGLLDQFHWNYVKQQLIRRPDTVDELEEELYQMEESGTERTKTSVLINQVLSFDQWNELRAHQMQERWHPSCP